MLHSVPSCKAAVWRHVRSREIVEFAAYAASNSVLQSADCMYPSLDVTSELSQKSQQNFKHCNRSCCLLGRNQNLRVHDVGRFCPAVGAKAASWYCPCAPGASLPDTAHCLPPGMLAVPVRTHQGGFLVQPDVIFVIVTLTWTASAPGRPPIWKHLCCITALSGHLRS